MNLPALDLPQDLRYALRRLRRSPGFTAAAIASLAIGIGATTAIYSVVEALLLRPLSGIATPERLVDVGRTQRGEGFDTFGYPDFLDVRANTPALAEVYAYDMNPHLVRVGNATDRALGFSVSGNYFDALGVRPEIGRFFRPDEETPHGGALVAVVSDAYFRRQLGGDARRLGETIYVDSSPLTLIGVTPPEFHGHVFALHPDVYVPISTALSDDPWQTRKLTAREACWLLIGGRLAPGATVASAQAELGGIYARLAKEFPNSHSERGALALPAKPIPGPGQTPVRLFSTLLFALVGLVLAIACMNVASMLLARAEERSREIAVRRALGAPQRRIVRQLLVESALLFALATPAALLLASWSVSLLVALRPPTPFPVHLEFPVDWQAALFALSIALASGLLFGLAPALRAARRDPQDAMKDGASGAGTRRMRGRRALVGAQLALSLLLLVAAGLLLRALDTAQRIDPGFQTAGVTAYEFNFDLAGYRGAAGHQALTQLIERAGALPGVDAVSATRVVPLELSRMSFGGVAIPGTESPSKYGFDADANVVAPGFFATLRIPLEGRDFDARDLPDGERVAIVNRAFAQRFFPAGALDRRFELVDTPENHIPYRIVGVAPDLKWSSLSDEPMPFYWLAEAQWTTRETSLLVRSSLPGAALDSAIAALARELDADLPPGPPRSLAAVATTSTLPQRLAASVAGSVGAVGLFLAAVGLYGVASFAVAARRRELAVRAALGARREELVRLVLVDSARPVAIGAAVGLTLSVALSRLLANLLFGISPTDLITFAGVPLLLGAVALLAVSIPARRAGAADPASVLRSE